MLNRIRIVTLLLSMLVAFGILQMASGNLFFKAIKSDKENFTLLLTIRQQQSMVNSSRISLLQTRNTLNRAGIRYMMDQDNMGSGDTVQELMTLASKMIKQAENQWKKYEEMPRDPRQSEAAVQAVKLNYDIYHGALATLIQFLNEGKLNAFFEQPTQRYEDDFERAYSDYLAQNGNVYQLAVDGSNGAYTLAKWVLFSVIAIVLIAIVLGWLGIQKTLDVPLQRLINSIRHIAKGDLAYQIDVKGSNEMGQLTDSLRFMQGELGRTVSDVRSGADAIYSSVSEIVMGNNDLSSRTEQQAASLEETAASMEQITATVKQNADNARQASQPAGAKRLGNGAKGRQSGG